MPNSFAYAALFLFPLVVVVLFRNMNKPTATIWSVVLGYLFLPVKTGIDLPMLPEYNRDLVPSLFALIMVLSLKDPISRRTAPASVGSDEASPAEAVQHRRGSRAPVLRSRLANILLILLLGVLPLGVYMTNTDPLWAGPTFLQGMSAYDAASMVLNTLVMLLPFFLGRYVLYGQEAQTTLLKVLVWGAMAYSLLILFEVRMSPQLHNWIYGFFPHSFIQHVRGGAWRPVVFLDHGLLVGMYMACAILAAACLYKAAKQTKPGVRPDHAAIKTYGLMLVWLLVVFVLSRNLGALLITCALLPLVLMMSRRIQITAVLILALTIGFYPMLRQAHVIPIEAIYEAALKIDEQRAESLKIRLLHEESLLYKAQERPVFGWGGYGRNRIYDEVTGQDLSITDGTWIITFGVSGWVGYLAMFGLLILPIYLLFRRRSNDMIAPATYGLAVMLIANLIDLLPNSSLTPLTWLMAGALLGAAERVPVGQKGPQQRGRQMQPTRRGPTPGLSRAPQHGGARSSARSQTRAALPARR